MVLNARSEQPTALVKRESHNTSATDGRYAKIFYAPDDRKTGREQDLSGSFQEEDRWIGKSVTCDLCKAFAGGIIRMVDGHWATDEIVKASIAFCKKAHIESDRVCDLVVPQFQDMVLGVVRDTVLNADEICSIVIGDSCALPYDPVQMWNITISSTPKPPVRPRVLPKPGSPTLRILHLSDIHLDIAYRSGADAECGEPLCCRAYDINPAPNTTRRAGQWGDYRACDVPWATLEQLFQHLSTIKDQFDLAYFTGDIPAHDVWNQTRPQQLANFDRLSNLFRTYLPNTPVYTCLGNHEGVPVNSFPPSTVSGESNQWLYSAQLEAWGYWLPVSSFVTIMRGGFYTFSPYPGFRIVALNSNYGSSENWWLLINQTDPEGQLQWLADVLQEAEDNRDKVHILSHHPPTSTNRAFAMNFYRLINRYESTVVGHFNGHSHKDQFHVFYDLHNKTRPVGVSYDGGSVTPNEYTNPAYRIYTIDGNYTGSSFEVLDFTHYNLDLLTANNGGPATWKSEYSAKDEYQMPSLFSQDWSNLADRMRDNDTLFQQYYTYYFKSAPHSKCTDSCKSDLLCSIKQAGSNDQSLC